MSGIKIAILVAFIALASSYETSPSFSSDGAIDMCQPCVAFADTNLQPLYQTLSGNTPPTTCSGLCSTIKDAFAQQICLYLCQNPQPSPSTMFTAVKRAGPSQDSIYFCESLNQICPVVNGGAAVINSTYVTPSTGGVNTVFKVQVIFTVTSATGTGQVLLTVTPPGTSVKPFSYDYFNEGFAVDSYSAKFEIPMTPQLPTGNYTGIVQICSGTCGLTNPGEATLAQSSIKFTVR
ncbi:unnamed protein product [Blepharisma stoltei]|uniref:Uncharacterized protein n=1 Tax=Blepharisma stoltei TaxID=1481888 RepID=A0AAU9KQ87_9CILI|nr:unnamed protein product [Blepharisma stoltei]